MSRCRCGHDETDHTSGGLKICKATGCPCNAFQPLGIVPPQSAMPDPTLTAYDTAGNSEPEPERSPFEEIAATVGRTVTEKNSAYGDAFAKCGQFLSLLFPDGIKPEQYRDGLALVRIFDKMMRIATDRDAFGESPYLDLAGYAILGAAMDQEPAVGVTPGEKDNFEELIRIITEHTHDNNPMREALRKCVGGG